MLDGQPKRQDKESFVTAYETIIVETKGRVGLITLNRPQALNALNSAADRAS